MSRPNRAYLRLFGQIDSVSAVETGTFKGNGVHIFLKSGFRVVHSIEANLEHWKNCTERFNDEIRAGAVVLHHGPSENQLRPVIDQIRGPIVYWLDAHLQGVELDASHCPLQEELEAIWGRGVADNDVIMIDDVRLLVNRRAFGGHGVNFSELIGELAIRMPNHFLCLIDGFTANDILCVVPRNLASSFFAVDVEVKSHKIASGDP
jgi:hypothetical protein